VIVVKPEQQMTAEERATTAQVSETLEVRNGRYRIGIPWKEGEPKFTNNYDVALVRLESREKSLKQKGPEVMEAYSKIFQDYERKNSIRQVPQSEVEKQWFLPHYLVIKEDRVTTKVRVVFDAAAKQDGKSLNDAPWPGPKLQRDLVDVLTRFRGAPVALSADISEMFLQVELQDKAGRITSSCGVTSTLQESLMCMSFSDYCLETLLHHFLPSMFFRPMPRHTLRTFLKQQALLKTRCMWMMH